jgi:hypothetical protein
MSAEATRADTRLGSADGSVATSDADFCQVATPLDRYYWGELLKAGEGEKVLGDGK